MYRKFIKRILDIVLSSFALLILSPMLLFMIILGAIIMDGNPFFIQKRPGKIDKETGKEKIFNLIKFRTMTNSKDEKGDLLPDKDRITRYGNLLRKTSFDEWPELINIIKGDMSIVGPRPLAVQYLPYYNSEERKRHTVLPGLTGLAQVNGRNATNWPERFAYDVEYVNNLSFKLDVKIIFMTIKKVLSRSDVSVRGEGNILDFDKFRMQELDKQGASDVR